MITKKDILNSILIAIWFMFLTFPIMVIRVNPIERIIQWRWNNMLMVGLAAFVLSFVWRFLFRRKEQGRRQALADGVASVPLVQQMMQNRAVSIPALVVLGIFFLTFPLFFSIYQTNIMTTALMYVVLGLGLNIVVGLAGLLDLGFAAFYAIGAYTYALLNYHYGLGFWAVLPIGAAMGFLWGILLGFPVLRLRGDYLAIVTLGFHEIIRLVLENWNAFSFGPSGIANIPRPGFFDVQLSLQWATTYMYYIVLVLVLFTIFVVQRLQNSRIGRAWIALREDEIACQSMGIDKTRTKLTAFALGATWAGMIGVIFSAKTTFINPASFTFMESVIILCIVVLGGMGSIIGVILGALVLILLPEYLRAFSDLRMLVFGAALVLMMIFKPDGFVANVRRIYQFKKKPGR